MEGYLEEIKKKTISFLIDKTNLDGPSGKLDPDGGFRLQVELVPCEAGQQVGLAHTGVADQDNW